MKYNSCRVLIVDDSALVRQLLTKILSSDPEIEVVGTAIDPELAKKKILETKPDVITLDVEMPKMDGVTFLRILMRNRPTPVVMISSLTERGAEITLDALEAGAVDFVNKPVLDISGTLEDFSEEIISKVKSAARVKVLRKEFSSQPNKTTTNTSIKSNPGKLSEAAIDEKFSATVILKRTRQTFQKINTTDKVIAIGASTGGTEAIKEILVKLPADSPSIVIAQHIPPVFSAAFANRLDKLTEISVSEAKDGQLMLPGHAYVAPGDQHLLVVRDGAKYRCKLSAGPPVNRHRPSVDVLFRSVAQSAGDNSLAILLTGMGADGAKGLLEIREIGGKTVAQDEKSSVVWGMPGEAVKIGAAMKVLPLELIYNEITSSFTAK